MSIKSSNATPTKRRKLSHSPSETLDTVVQSTHSQSTEKTMQASAQRDEKEQTNHHPQRSSGSASRMNGLTISGAVTKSSVMALQVEELLEDVRSTTMDLQRVKPTLDRIVEMIKTSPKRTALSLAQAEKLLRKQQVAIPFTKHRPASDIKYSFDFQPPQILRSRLTPTSDDTLKGNSTVELAVEMPSSMFQEKDYLNYRAFHKRAHFIACLASVLRQSLEGEAECTYSLRDENSLLPVICLQFGAEASNVQVCVHAKFPSEIGPIERTLPNKNCIRGGIEASRELDAPMPATPFYNSVLRSTSSLFQVDELLESTARKCEFYNDACMLGQVWLRQRRLDGTLSTGGFGPSEWAIMCALLLSGGGHRGRPLFSPRYSSLQLFKAMLQVLSGRDLVNEPLSIHAGSVDMQISGLPILYDGSSGANILYKMSASSYEFLRSQAQLSLAAANARNKDNFDLLFISKVADSMLQFDELYCLDISAHVSATKSDQIQILNSLYDVLKKGLGDRVSLLDVRQSASGPWDINRTGPILSSQANILEIGLQLNAEAAARTIDHGPSADEPDDALAFRKFWGDKSELRRFRDGRITETLVWSAESPVTLQIIQYLLLSHFQVLPRLIKQITCDIAIEHLRSHVPVTAGDAFKLINTKYQELSSKLHQLEGLPLPIRSVSPSDPALRSTSLGHPLAPSTVRPIGVLIQFDSSARWPDHLAAIQYTKIAFLTKLADLLSENDPSISTRIGIENVDASTAGYLNTSFLDIIYASSAPGLSAMVFRIRIHHDREPQLLQSAISTSSSSARENLSAALLQYKRQFVAGPSHTATTRNLITHFVPLSTTIRLLVSWVASHNLSNHLPNPVVEILASHVFLNHAPWSVPGSATTAFLRCLHFLSRWDWTSRPLIVDLSLTQDMLPSSYQELETRFQAWKKLDPAMNNVAWFVGTNIDSTGTIWTQGATPSRVVASRVTALAKAAIDLVRQRGSSMNDEDWKSLFISPLSDFDFVIHLKPKFLRGAQSGRERKNGATRFKNLQVQDDLDIDKIGHDVIALFLQDLEKAFGSSVLFFHGEAKGVIAGLWKPSVRGIKEWRVRLGYSSIPVSQELADPDHEGSCTFNENGTLTEMAMLAGDMIERISVKKS